MHSLCVPSRRLLWLSCLAIVLGQAVGRPVRAEPDAQSLADEPRSLSFVGYHHHAQTPTVWVTTNEPTKAWLTVVAGDHARLHLEHAVLARSLLSLPIDTSCFGGAITSVQASPQEEPQTGVVVDIRHAPTHRLRLSARGTRISVWAEPARHHAKPRRPRARHLRATPDP